MRLALLSLVALAGCSLVGGAPAEVRFTAALPDGAAIQVSAAADGLDVPLVAQSNDGRRLVSDAVDVSAGGVDLSCAVSAGGASTRGTVGLALAAGWEYTVDCAVGDENPAAACFGCQGTRAFALDPALGRPPSDSLFVTWSGVDPENPVVY